MVGCDKKGRGPPRCAPLGLIIRVNISPAVSKQSTTAWGQSYLLIDLLLLICRISDFWGIYLSERGLALCPSGDLTIFPENWY